MDSRERLLYHQIHPLKLLTDVATAILAAVLLWAHRLGAAAMFGLIPSIVITAALVRWADLERYRRSRFGQYVARFMTHRVEAARFAGLIPLWGGAWLHQPAIILLGAAWIVACWLWGLRRPPFDPPAI